MSAAGGEDSDKGIVGGIGGLRMANSFSDSASDNGGGRGGGGANNAPTQAPAMMSPADGNRSASPATDEIVAAAATAAPRVSPPAGGTQQQNASPSDHKTPTPAMIEAFASGSAPPLPGTGAAASTVRTGGGPGLPFRNGRTVQVHELTPVIRNTSGSGDDLDHHVSGGGGAAGGAHGNIISPEGPDRGPMLELSIPRGGTISDATSIGNMKQLPPRPSALPMPSSSHVRQTGPPHPSRPAPQSIEESRTAATIASAASSSSKTTSMGDQLPPRQATRSHSAGNLDSESLVKTVREYYSMQATEGARGLHDDVNQEASAIASSKASASTKSASQEARHAALAQRQTEIEEQARREQLAIERALASVGGDAASLQNANIPQAIQHAVEEVGYQGHVGIPRVHGPPPGPPIPLPTGERKAVSFDFRPPPGSKPPPMPASPKAAGISTSNSASPGRSGLPPLRGSSGPASQYLQPSDSIFSPKPYVPSRQDSFGDYGQVGDAEGLDAIFKEGRTTKILSPRRSAHTMTDSPSTGVFQSSSQNQLAPDSPSLRRTIPLDERDWSIPSIRLAHHVNSGESCTTVETYDDELDDEDDVAAARGSGGYGEFDDATLSSRGSQAKLSPDVDMAVEDEEDDRKPSAVPPEETNQVIIEQGIESVTHRVDDAGTGAADSVHAVAAPPSVFRTVGERTSGDKKRHRKNRKSEEALQWLKNIEVGGVAEAASSKFLTSPAPAAAGLGVGMGPSRSPTTTAPDVAFDAAAQSAAPSAAAAAVGVQGALKPYAANRQTPSPADAAAKQS